MVFFMLKTTLKSVVMYVLVQWFPTYRPRTLWGPHRYARGPRRVDK